MTSLWWLALPVLVLPILWHRQKRERIKAAPLATARFLPHADPQQRRVWQWVDRLLLLARCLLLVALIAWLADLSLPWRGDTVLVAAATDRAWAARQIDEAEFKSAQTIRLDTDDALAWFAAHERDWHPDARLLALGAQPMAATMPRLRHAVELHTLAPAVDKVDYHVTIVGKRREQWRAMFAAIDGPARYLVDDEPGASTDLIVWDSPEGPATGLQAASWWVIDTTAFPELRAAPAVDGMQYMDSARGRLWSSPAWPPRDAAAARALFEHWQQIQYPAQRYIALAQTLAADPAAPLSGGGLRDLLAWVLLALFAIERSLAHARRR